MVPFEQKMKQGGDAALREASRFHTKQGAVHESLGEIVQELNELGVAYAVLGGMALVAHGYDRATVDIDMLVTAEGFDAIRCELVGGRYQFAFRRPFSLRNTETGVRIDFFVAGVYPGDGKPKPVSFPDPADVAVEIDGIRYVYLPTLIELKLASGMTQPARRRDLADVQDLIRTLDLDESFASGLNPYVREVYNTLLGESRCEDPHREESSGSQ